MCPRGSNNTKLHLILQHNNIPCVRYLQEALNSLLYGNIQPVSPLGVKQEDLPKFFMDFLGSKSQ